MRLAMHQSLMNELFEQFAIANPILWYYTPAALPFTHHLPSSAIVYDCMDELSAFKFAPQAMKDRENEMFQKADLVFTGGYSLYEAKKNRHHDVHPFPSSIDTEHYFKARVYNVDPEDQARLRTVSRPGNDCGRLPSAGRSWFARASTSGERVPRAA